MSFHNNRKASITVTATTDAEAIGDNKVICTGVEIPKAVLYDGDTCLIKSVTVLDIETISPAVDIVFSNVNNVISQDQGKLVGEDVDSLHTILEGVEGIVKVANSDYTNLVDGSVASKSGIDLACGCASGSTSLFMHIINRSGGNWTATTTDSMIVKIGVEY